MLDYSISYFLGDYWSNTPLYSEKIIPLMDHILSNNFEMSDKMASAFYELSNKYQNTADLPVENIKAYIGENGYGYIIDLLDADEESLKIVVYLLVLIHQLKGSEEGLKLVLSLFKLEEPERGIDEVSTVITQWYNTLPVGEENTFKIESTMDVSKVSSNFYESFSKFIKNYVYPELTELRIRYALKAKKTQLPYVTLKMNYTSFADMDT